MNRRIRIGVSLGLAILMTDAAIPFVMSHLVESQQASLQSLQSMNSRLARLLSAYQDAETGQRGFMLTGHEDFLEPYVTGRQHIARLLPEIQEDVRHLPSLTADWHRLLNLEQREASYQATQIQARRNHAVPKTEDALQGKALMDAIRLHLNSMGTRIHDEITAVEARVEHLENWSRFSLVTLTALVILLFWRTYLFAARLMRDQHAAVETAQTATDDLQREAVRLQQAMQALADHAGRLNAIIDTQTLMVRSELDLERFLNTVVDNVARLTQAHGVVVEMVDADEMVYRSACGAASPFVGFRLKRAGSLSGLCIEQQSVLISNDTSIDPRVDYAACQKIGVASMVVAPLIRTSEPVGVLKIMGNTPSAFTERDVQTLQLMAGLLGAALGHQLQFDRNAMLLEERGQALRALERELNRREQYEAALLQQQETLHAITDNMPALVSFVDQTEHYRYCNQQYLDLLGVEPDWLVGRTMAEFLGAEEYAEMKPHIDRALAGEAATYERDLDTPEGKRHVEGRLIPQLGKDGAVAGFYLMVWDVTERRVRELEMTSRASVDALTGLLNRAFFLEALERSVTHHQVSGEAMAVFYLDVDRFKHINDTYGHAAGDALLQAFASHLRRVVRDSDLCGRLGGDEFCLVLNHVRNTTNAVAVAEKIRQSVQRPVVFEGTELVISTSIGIAFMDKPMLSAAELVAQADAALYKAKKAGRNRYALEMVSAAATAP